MSRLPDVSWRAERPIWPHVLLVAGVLTGLFGFVLTPRVMDVLGLGECRMWFLDSYAILAALDALAAGLDPTKPNPLDVFGRPHVYSDWWYALGQLGLTRDHNFLVGASWSVAFLAVAWCTLRPASHRESGWFALIMLSPPVLLAIARGNNDLVIFTLLGLAAMALNRPTAPRCGTAAAAIALATGLKFYPVVAVAVFLLMRPARKMLLAFGGAVLAAGGVLLAVWPSMARGQFPIPPSLYVFGAGMLFGDLGLTGRWPLLGGFAVMVLAAVFLVRSKCTVGLAESMGSGFRRTLFILGAAVLLACFAAGTSYAYRWIFALWLAPWLTELAYASDVPRARRSSARVTAALLALVLWGDGLVCLGVNLLLVPSGITTDDRLLVKWRFLMQPVVWTLMTLLAGWLLDAAVSAWREVRSRAVVTTA